MERIKDLTKEELAKLVIKLENTIQELSNANQELVKTNESLTNRISILEKELKDLRSHLSGGGSKTVIPDIFRPGKVEEPKKEKKKRTSSYVRKREKATREVIHALDECPNCGWHLSGGTIGRTSQILELPYMIRYEVIEHKYMVRKCGVCGKRCIPKADKTGVAVGKGRMGIGLMSYISYLHIEGRMPIETIQGTLKTVYGLKISIGQITEVLHKVADKGKFEYEKILEKIRNSSVVNMDETSWRENGRNYWLWNGSTPEARYYKIAESRSGEVAREIPGEEYRGVIVSDFYKGYDKFNTGHQKCWVHLIRDLKKLKE